MRASIIGCGIAGPALAIALQRVGVEVRIHEARPEPSAGEGAFLMLAPNGLNVLRTLGVYEQVTNAGYPCSGLVFYNSHGRRISEMDYRGEEDRHGAGCLMIRRAELNRILRETALAAGVAVHHGRSLVGIAEGRDGVGARFADGSTDEADVLLGCDGVHARSRALLFPDGPVPVYTGLVSSAGFTRLASVDAPAGEMRMIFGRGGFFSYTVSPDGEIWWFDNAVHPTGERRATDSASLRRELLALYADDLPEIRDIVRATERIGQYPIHDIPFLPTWHRGRTCLVGDAAHATSPHAGQGASMALEDTVVLAMCLRDLPTPTAAFSRFEALRRARVERLIREARRRGDPKGLTNPIAIWFRDRMLPVFVKLGARSLGEVHGYRVRWEDSVAAAP